MQQVKRVTLLDIEKMGIIPVRIGTAEPGMVNIKIPLVRGILYGDSIHSQDHGILSGSGDLFCLG